jgi:hypothetical protein
MLKGGEITEMSRYEGLTWTDWQAMGWRERALVRRYREPPSPPVQVFLTLTDAEQEQIRGLARDAGCSVQELITPWIRNGLARRRRTQKTDRPRKRGRSQPNSKMEDTEHAKPGHKKQAA